MRIQAFIWDRFNIEKCQKHGLDIGLIEDFLLGDPFVLWDEAHSDKEDRYIAFGYLNRRLIFVVFTLRISQRKLKFRVLSARFAREKEILRLLSYEEQKK
jgi:uncharacterized DUF497 family protein